MENSVLYENTKNELFEICHKELVMKVAKIIHTDKEVLIITTDKKVWLYDYIFNSDGMSIESQDKIIRGEFKFKSSVFIRYKFKLIKNRTPYLKYII